MKPAQLGDIVIYHCRPAVLGVGPELTLEELEKNFDPALVLRVHDDGSVNLFVFSDAPYNKVSRNVPHGRELGEWLLPEEYEGLKAQAREGTVPEESAEEKQARYERDVKTVEKIKQDYVQEILQSAKATAREIPGKNKG